MAKSDTKTSVKTVKEESVKASVKKLDIMLEPRATEKTYFEQTKRTYAFFVPLNMSKQAVAKAVSEQFSVTVTDVRTLLRKGKKTRYSKGRHAYPGTTYRRDHKVAYVTLKDGDSIKVFEDPEADKTEKVDKKADKKADKKSAKTDSVAKKSEKKGDK